RRCGPRFTISLKRSTLIFSYPQAGRPITPSFGGKAENWAFPLSTPKPGDSNQHPASLNVKTAPSWRGIVSFTHLAREGRMTVTIGRRELLAALGGAAAWPLAARAQQPAMPVVGFLDPTSADAEADRLRAFRQGLKDAGFVEGENVEIVYRFAENQSDR